MGIIDLDAQFLSRELGRILENGTIATEILRTLSIIVNGTFAVTVSCFSVCHFFFYYN
jgi:hypothetical protein